MTPSPSDLEIRAFVPADEEGVAALWRDVFSDEPPWNEPERIVRTKTRVQPELFLVAVLGSNVVGTVIGGFDGVRGWIHHLAVVPGSRRRGIGSALMRAAEDGLALMGCPKVNLQVRSTNSEVIAFYRALDYGVEERVSMGKVLVR